MIYKEGQVISECRTLNHGKIRRLYVIGSAMCTISQRFEHHYQYKPPITFPLLELSRVRIDYYR